MSKIESKTFVPELRFPEFVGQELWVSKKLEDICSLQAGKFVKAASIKNEKSGNLYPCYGGNGLRGFTKSFTHSGNYSLIGRQGALCGNINFASGTFHATEHAVVVEPKHGIDNLWLYYELCRLNLNQFATGQAQPGLSVDNLYKVDTCVPVVGKEQQKIGACLSSMDNLIVENVKKLESLKLHKKGLMQKLFPDEGKSVPELGFTCNVKWNKKTFEEVYSLKTTNSLSRDKLNYDDGLVKNIHYGDIHTKFSTLFDITKESVPFINAEIALDKVKEEYYCQEGDMVFADASEDIDDVGKSIELINLNGEKLLSGLHTILARQKGSYLVKGFGGYLFKSEVLRKQIQKESQGAKVLGISATRISKIDVVYPIEQSEQQRIVDCLSSLDKLIDAQTKKIEILNIYKKGLMQQLFPEIKEAIA